MRTFFSQREDDVTNKGDKRSGGQKGRAISAALLGIVAVAVILVFGTFWMGQSAKKDTDRAVRSVSLLYLNELVGRREQVVEKNLQDKINVIHIAIDLMSEEDLSDKAHLEAYQRRMKQLYSLDKFAFVDTEGLIYTSMGTQNNIEEYDFDHTALSEPKISIFHLENSDQRQVIIAVPTNVPFGDKTLSVCFMAIDMAEMLSGLSMDYQRSDATFSNIYTSGGVALTNQVLGGQAAETNLLEALKGVTFDEGYSYEQVAADFAKMKLRQILINILGNAVKFTPKGGKVELTVERLIRFENKTTLCFTIADTGIGISKEFLPKLFDTFSQEDSSNASKYGSSGLGLAITKNIVEMMNGSISVESEKGEGTTFRVKVTLMNSSPHEAEADAIVHPSDMTVLIVDDDPVACEHAKLVLEKTGIAAELASSGAEAIEKVQLRHARREPYNLILVDWQMPEMDGVEATRRIREIIGHESAIIILTAYRWDDVLEEALRAGVDSFIPKPLFLATVMEEFKSALLKKNAAAKQTVRKAELTGRRVLLAEDVPVNAEIMLMVLQMRSIEAELAENGRIAVEKFQAHEPGYFDAILMDMRMPEMDGLEATRTIRAMDRADAKTIPIIALTANAFDEDVQRSLQAGLNAHLSKPVQPDALFETLEGLIQP